MSKYTTLATLISVTISGGAIAGGLDNSGQDTSIIFNPGDHYVELGYRATNPSVDGTLGTLKSENMVDNSSSLTLGGKIGYNDKLDFAVTYNQPYGANVEYDANAIWPVAGSSANVDSTELTGLAKYRVNQNFSVYGGVKRQTVEGQLVKTAKDPRTSTDMKYTYDTDKSAAFGGVVGAAYERPEIAMRVALTLHTKVDHDWEVKETYGGILGGADQTTTTVNSKQTYTTPQAINLDFQSGVAKDTLVFGSVRRAEWGDAQIPSKLHAAPDARPIIGEPVSSFKNSTTLNLGVGRKLNENWSVAGTFGYEKSTGDEASNLAPSDGYKSFGLGATYTLDNLKITGGVARVNIGDAETSLGGAKSDFSDNSATVVGIKVGYGF